MAVVLHVRYGQVETAGAFSLLREHFRKDDVIGDVFAVAHWPGDVSGMTAV